MLEIKKDVLLSSTEMRPRAESRAEAATRVAQLVAGSHSRAKGSQVAESPGRTPRSAARASGPKLEQLNVRVQRRVNVLLKKLDYLCADRGIDTNKQELVQFWLSQLPTEVSDDFVRRLAGFQQSERSRVEST